VLWNEFLNAEQSGLVADRTYAINDSLAQYSRIFAAHAHKGFMKQKITSEQHALTIQLLEKGKIGHTIARGHRNSRTGSAIAAHRTMRKSVRPAGLHETSACAGMHQNRLSRAKILKKSPLGPAVRGTAGNGPGHRQARNLGPSRIQQSSRANCWREWVWKKHTLLRASSSNWRMYAFLNRL